MRLLGSSILLKVTECRSNDGVRRRSLSQRRTGRRTQNLVLGYAVFWSLRSYSTELTEATQKRGIQLGGRITATGLIIGDGVLFKGKVDAVRGV